MAQTSYNVNPSVGFAGMLADSGNIDAVSRTASAAVPFGRFVKESGDRAAALVDTDLAGLAGVALHQHKEPSSAGVAQYEAGETMDVLKRGRVLVWCEEAVAPGDPVYIRVTAGTAGQELGQVRKTADTGKAVLEARCSFDTQITAAGLVAVNVNLP